MYCYAFFLARNSSGATLHKYSVYDVPLLPCVECVLGDPYFNGLLIFVIRVREDML